MMALITGVLMFALIAIVDACLPWPHPRPAQAEPRLPVILASRIR
jgi:hypothetical protein